MPDLKTVTFDASQWQLVPKSPVDTQLNAIADADGFDPYALYAAMLAAAPTPAAQSAGQEAVAYLHESTGRLLHAQSRELCDNRRREWTALGRIAAPVSGGEREKPAPLLMSGWQLLEALDLIAPDRDTDLDQLDGEIALQMGDESSHSGAGLYAWDAEYPEEGSSFLAGERAAGGRERSDYGLSVDRILDLWERYPGAEFPDQLRAASTTLTSPAKVGGDELEAFTVDKRRIASIVHTDCSLIPGATHYNAAEMAIDAVMAAYDRAALSADGGDRKDAEQFPALAQLLAAHASELESNAYAYFELAYTRHTDWMAWICSNSRESDPGRKVIARGQGATPEEACRSALAAKAKGDAQ